MRRCLIVFAVMASLVILGEFFKDVPEGHWAYDAVKNLYEEGIVKSSEKFRGNDFSTRYEVAVMVYRAILYLENKLGILEKAQNDLAGRVSQFESLFEDVKSLKIEILDKMGKFEKTLEDFSLSIKEISNRSASSMREFEGKLSSFESKLREFQTRLNEISVAKPSTQTIQIPSFERALDRLDSLEISVEKIKMDLEKLRTRVGVKEDDIASLKNMMKDIDARIKILENRMKTPTGDDLKGELSTLQNFCGNLSETVEKLGNELENLKTFPMKIRAELKTFNEKIENLESSFESSLTTLRKEFLSAEKHPIEEIKSDTLETIQASVMYLESETLALQSEYAKFKRWVEKSFENSKTKFEEIGVLKRAVDDMSSTLKDLKDEIDDLKVTLNRDSQFMENWARSLGDIQNELGILKNRMERMENDISSQRSELKRLKSDLENVSKLENRVRDLESDFDDVTATIEETKMKFSSLSNDVENLKAGVNDIREELSNFGVIETRLENLENNLRNLSGDLDENKYGLEKIKDRVSKLEGDLRNQNVWTYASIGLSALALIATIITLTLK